MFVHELLQGAALINNGITSTPYGTCQPAELVGSDGFRAPLRRWSLQLSVLDRCVPAGWLHRGWKLRQTRCSEWLCIKLTWPRLDLDRRAAPDVLLHLRHTLSGRLVGVVSGAHRDLVLNAALALQVIPALPVQRRGGGGGKKRFRSVGLQILWLDFTGCLSNGSVGDSFCHHFLTSVRFLVSVKQLLPMTAEAQTQPLQSNSGAFFLFNLNCVTRLNVEWLTLRHTDECSRSWTAACLCCRWTGKTRRPWMHPGILESVPGSLRTVGKRWCNH